MPNTTTTISVLARDDPKGFVIAPHAHAEHQIVHASSGVMRVTTSEASWVVPQGRALWMPARKAHWISCVTDVSMRTVYLAPDRRREWPRDCTVWSVTGLMRELILRLVEGPDDAGHENLLVALLVAEIGRADEVPLNLPLPSDPRLKRVADALLAAPEDNRPLRAWARDAGASERTLIRLFARETGMAFREWRRQARLLAALERLAEGEAVGSVALDLGYSGPSAFIQAFRDVLGVTPARYFVSRSGGEGSG